MIDEVFGIELGWIVRLIHIVVMVLVVFQFRGDNHGHYYKGNNAHF